MIGLDEYTRNARLKPALLTVLPAAWTVMIWSPLNEIWGPMWGLIVAAGGTLLLSQMGRDRGKRKEKELHDHFAGRPSERLLSHEFAPNKILLGQRHAKLRALLPDVRIPSAEEEMRDPATAHATYNACVNHMIARTRENRLLFQENINYGFRRNLWGLKPFGRIISAAAAVALGARIYRVYSTGTPGITPLLIFETLNILMFVAWIFWFTRAWVMIPARAYADRLMEALDTL